MCVSIKGDTKVDKGDSICYSDIDAKAVAVNDSDALADDDAPLALAVNRSSAGGEDYGRATAVNDSFADAINCTATAQNGEAEVCESVFP